MGRVAVTDGMDSVAVNRLISAGHEVIERQYTKDELLSGVLSDFELLPSEGSSVTLEGEKITVRNLGEEIQNPTLPSDKSRKTVFFNSWIYNTASRIKLDIPAATPVPGTTSDFNHKSKIDKSQLKTGDKVSVFRRGEFIPIETDVTVTVGTNDIGLGVSFTNDGITEYDIQRQLVKANAASDLSLIHI